MDIITWIIVGVIAGWLVSLVMKGRGYGVTRNIIIGIAGVFAGGWFSN